MYEKALLSSVLFHSRGKRRHRVFPLFILVVLVSTICFAPEVHAPYRDYDPFIAAFKSLASDYPGLVTYETVGKTVEDRGILMFKIGNPAGGRVLFDGALHGTENIGGELLYLYAEWLLTSSDPLAKTLLKETCTLLIPAVNVDRYNRARKNANGVDLNRNFATRWENGISDPNHDTYRGPAPLSEPESQTIINVFQTYKPKFYVNLHMWAGPYYAGSSYISSTRYSYLVNKVTSLGYERRVPSLRFAGQFGGAGMAISDAARAGVTSFLIELTPQVLSNSEIRSVLLPKFILIAAVLSQEASLSPPQDNVDEVYEDGFESGDFSWWTGTTTSSGESVTVVGTLPYHGNYHGRFASNGGSGTEYSYCYKVVEEEEVYAQGYFYIAQGLPLTDDGDRFYFLRLRGGNQSLAGAGIRRNGGVNLWVLYARDESGWVGPLYASSPIVDEERWYHVELHWKRDSTHGLVEMYVDSVKVLEATNINTDHLGNIEEVDFGLISATDVQNSLTIYGDSFKLSTQDLYVFIGDLNQDGDVNIWDVTIVATAYGSQSGEPRWNSVADTNSDGLVDIYDLTTVAMYWGS